MNATLRSRIYNWMFQLKGPESGAIVLVQRRVFILPTRQGLLFAGVLTLMLVGSLNYNLSLGYILTFLLGSMGINAMLQTFRNLANLRVFPGRTNPVFAGETARFVLNLENTGDGDRYAIGLTHDRIDSSYFDVPARSVTAATIGIPAPRRGVMRPGRLRLFTQFPLGLYYAWAYAEMDMTCLVYPAPAPPGVPFPERALQHGVGSEHGLGQNDFVGLRQYLPGDSPRHIAWKAAARGQDLLTKQFAGQSAAELWLDWDMLPARAGTEERLSQLARWVVDAQAAGLVFGLAVPGTVIPPGTGEAHRDRCLEALALFEQPAGAP